MPGLIHKLEENIIALLLVSMTILVFIETILRFGFGIGLLWAEELTLHMSAWMVLFGASYGLRVGAHIGVDFVIKKLTPPLQRIASLTMLSATLIYCGLFMYGSWIYLYKMSRVGITLEDIPVPKYIAHSILLIGFALLAIRLAEVAWRIYKGEITRLPMHDEAQDSMKLKEELSSQALDSLENAGGKQS